MNDEKETPKLLGEYMNGVIHTRIFSDGTKIREVEDDQDFIADFAETMDVNISQRCSNNCGMCYANCTLLGMNADFNKYVKLFSSLHPYTELAVNINSDFHPNFMNFLLGMRGKKAIVNATINQRDFEKHYEELLSLTRQQLIWGLGISLVDPTPEFLAKFRQFPNGIIHVINGIVTEEQIKAMYDQDIKMLILGYKMVGRGISWYGEEGHKILDKQIWLKENLPEIANHFAIISFDNLAVEQLEVKNLVDEEIYNERFLGEDGSMSFYINLVEGYFARNSLSDIHYPIGDKTVDECFKIIQINKE